MTSGSRGLRERSESTIGLVQCNLLQPDCRSAAAPLPLSCRCGVVGPGLGVIGGSVHLIGPLITCSGGRGGGAQPGVGGPPPPPAPDNVDSSLGASVTGESTHLHGESMYSGGTIIATQFHCYNTFCHHKYSRCNSVVSKQYA
jgi:hypothetical protein